MTLARNLHKMLGKPVEMAPPIARCSKGERWYLVMPRTLAKLPKPLPSAMTEVLILEPRSYQDVRQRFLTGKSGMATKWRKRVVHRKSYTILEIRVNILCERIAPKCDLSNTLGSDYAMQTDKMKIAIINYIL